MNMQTRAPRPPLNGVDTPTLLNTIAVVAGQPELAKFQFRAHNEWVSGTHSRGTIADYFGACLLTLGEVIRCDFSAYPNIERWLSNMKRLRSWPKVNEALYGFAEAVKDQKFEAI